MSSLKDLASLIMVPSLYKDGELHTVKPLADEDVIIHPDATGNHDGNDGTTDRNAANFTFSRGSNLAATRVDVNGLIEKGRENLVTYSNNFNNWSKASGASVTSGQAGYDGSSDAWLATSVSNTQPYQVYKGWSTYGVLTFSVYAKANTGTIFNIDFAIPDNGYVRVDLSDGSVISESGSSTYIGSNVVSVGGGWYRISVTANVTNSAYIRAGLYQTAGSVYIQDAQVEQGLVATDYIETGASTAQAGILEDMPRLDYSGSCPALLLEPQRTNHYYKSEYFSTGSRVVIENNSTTSPEGLQNATSVIATSTYGSHEVTLSPIISIANTNPRTFSVYAKYNGNHLILNVAGSSTAWAGCVFDLQNGIAKTPQNNGSQSACTADIEDAGNGWYRCSVTYTPYASGGFLHLISLTDDIDATLTTWGADEYAGDDVSGIYIYGAQVEQGSYPTSYIPTYGSSVTRSNDSCQRTGASDLLGQEQGVVFLDFTYKPVFDDAAGQTTFRFSISNNTYSNRVIIYPNNSNELNILANGVVFTGSAYSLTEGQRYKVAIAYGDTSVCYINGVEAFGYGSGTPVGGYSQIQFSDAINASTRTFASPVNQAVIFKTRLTNAELAALTTI